MKQLQNAKEALEYFESKKHTRSWYNGVYLETGIDLEPPKVAKEALEELEEFMGGGELLGSIKKAIEDTGLLMTDTEGWDAAQAAINVIKEK